MLPVLISYRAEEDAKEAGIWYDTRLSSLSIRFYSELKEYLLKIQGNPFSFPERKRGSIIRQCSLKKFPYNLFYIIEDKHIAIIAILHKSRSYRFIKNRLK